MTDGRIKIDVRADDFITNTRVKSCDRINCEFNLFGEGTMDMDCQLKRVSLDASGSCTRYVEKPKPKKKRKR